MIVELNAEELKAVVGGSMASPHVAAKRLKEAKKEAGKEKVAKKKLVASAVFRSNGSGSM